MSTCGFQVPTRQRDIGAFQQLPVVSPGCEILGTAVRRAKMVRPTKGMVLLFGFFFKNSPKSWCTSFFSIMFLGLNSKLGFVD